MRKFNNNKNEEKSIKETKKQRSYFVELLHKTKMEYFQKHRSY